MSTSVTKAGLKAASDKIILAARPIVEQLRLFSTNFSVDRARKGDGVVVEVLSATAGDFGAANGYTKSTNTIRPATVLLNKHKKSTFTISDVDDLENEFAPIWGSLSPVAALAVAKQAVADAIGCFTYDKRLDTVTKNPSTLADWTDLRALIVAKNLNPEDGTLILRPDYYAKLLSVLPANIYGDGEVVRRARIGEFLGFKAVIEAPNATNISGAAVSGVSPTNGFGFFAPTGCLGVAARTVQPVKAGGNLIEFGTIQDEETGFVFGQRVVVDADQGTCSWTVDSLYGAALTRETGADEYDNKAPGFLQLLKA